MDQEINIQKCDYGIMKMKLLILQLGHKIKTLENRKSVEKRILAGEIEEKDWEAEREKYPFSECRKLQPILLHALQDPPTTTKKRSRDLATECDNIKRQWMDELRELFPNV